MKMRTFLLVALVVLDNLYSVICSDSISSDKCVFHHRNAHVGRQDGSLRAKHWGCLHGQW